jgi:hypothetical protein
MSPLLQGTDITYTSHIPIIHRCSKNEARDDDTP